MRANSQSMFPIALAILSVFAMSAAVAKPGDPIPGLDVQLQQGEQTVAKTATDASGHFSFTHVAAGTYSVRFGRPAISTAGASKEGGISAMDDWESPVSLKLSINLSDAGSADANGAVTSPRDSSTGQSSGKVTSPRDSSTGQSSGKVTSPRDASSGMATGKRMHKPFVITKELDRKSPTLGVNVPSDTVAEVSGMVTR